MLDIHLSRRSTNCNGQSRRDFLRVGGLGMLGLSLADVLRLETFAKQSGGSGKQPRAKSIVLVYLGGGLSHHDSFDMKPDAAEEIRGKYDSIGSTLSGLRVCELLPQMAQTMHK